MQALIKIIKIKGEDKLRRSVMRVERKVIETSDDFAVAAAETLKNTIRKNWSSTSPSSKGSPPAKVTGNLDSSIFIEGQSRSAGGQFAGSKGAYRYIVIDTSKGSEPLGRGNYSDILENELERPFLQSAIDEVMPVIAALAKQKIKVR